MPPFFCRVLMFTRPVHFREGLWASHRVPIDSSPCTSPTWQSFVLKLSERTSARPNKFGCKSRAVQLGWTSHSRGWWKEVGQLPHLYPLLFSQAEGLPFPTPPQSWLPKGHFLICCSFPLPLLSSPHPTPRNSAVSGAYLTPWRGRDLGVAERSIHWGSGDLRARAGFCPQ